MRPTEIAMSRLALVTLLGIPLMALPVESQSAGWDAHLANLFQSYHDAEFQRHPVFATQQGNHEYDDRMDDLSPEARAADVDRATKLLATLDKEIDAAKLSPNSRIDLD